MDWRGDKQLVKYEQYVEECEMFSFDIFDTLLFRKCERPVDVFALVWCKALRIFPELPYTSAEYINLRRTAEQVANKKNRPVHNFENIFVELDFPLNVIDYLKKEEIETEKEVIYLNEGMYSLIRYLHKRGKKIVLVSDMYHSKKTLCTFLVSAGVDVNIFSEVYVSSEYNCYKGDGRLFQRMLDTCPEIPLNRIVHIGDSESADFLGAQKAGIQSVFYKRENSEGIK